MVVERTKRKSFTRLQSGRQLILRLEVLILHNLTVMMLFLAFASQTFRARDLRMTLSSVGERTFAV